MHDLVMKFNEGENKHGVQELIQNSQMNVPSIDHHCHKLQDIL